MAVVVAGTTLLMMRTSGNENVRAVVVEMTTLLMMRTSGSLNVLVVVAPRMWGSFTEASSKHFNIAGIQQCRIVEVRSLIKIYLYNL